jgi:uncharacterized membrane protein
MSSRLRELRDYLLGTLWFVPALLVLAAIAAAIGMVELSAHVDGEALSRWPRVFGASAGSSRSILSGVASGMITVAGLVFSLTMVAVTQASSQYTSRILRTFMGDRPNQVVLGTFVGIFAYCLVVLRTIRSETDDGDRFVPSLAVVLGIALAIAGIGVLIYFVHHIASTLQASFIVARVAAETAKAIESLFPQTLGEEARGDEARAVRAASTAPWCPVPAPQTGYVQSVDEETLLAAAVECDGLIRMERSVGEFVTEGLPLASIAADAGRRSAMAARLAGAFRIGRYRTIEQDAAFGLRQLVDIALRALSPGINDTTTAVSCIDYLGATLIRLAGRHIESPIREKDGTVRVLARGQSYESLLRLACDEIRQGAAGNVSVLHHLLTMLGTVAGCVTDAGRRALLLEQMALVHEVAERTVVAPHERERLRVAYYEVAREGASHTIRG